MGNGNMVFLAQVFGGEVVLGEIKVQVDMKGE